VKDYGELRNFPAVDGTSGISVHLRFGTVSIRECVRRALQKDSDGANKWLSELIWRDFYSDILSHRPEVVHTTFDPAYRELVWPGSDEHYQAWEEGMTGYPIVDAAMRCFNKTGWMHNRLRMIVASFLTKDLLVDYKRGEAYFARKLLDFDLASNNGGWQWAASTGCDAQPHFRIFNPYLQSEKFDKEGKFIREWIPELSGLVGKSLHSPTSLEILGTGYPKPIVQHDLMRPKAIELLSSARKEFIQKEDQPGV
jgi:deoxyribodipyrimidine photo-lyase